MDTHQKTILLVEDDHDNRRLTKDLLSFQNYRIIEAEDGYQALDFLQEHTPDLIMTDIALPGIDGFTLTKNIRAQERFDRVPIIILTAYLPKMYQEVVQSTSLLQYISKPVNISALLAQIQEFMDGTQVADESGRQS